MKKVFLFLSSLLLRLSLAPIFHHSDPDNYYYWGKYLWETKNFAGFLGKAVPNAMTATYPPVFYYLLFFWRGLYESLERLLWWINLKLPLFPSNLIFWFQSYETGIAFNKIPAIIADFGCGYLIYKIAREIGASQKPALWATLGFLFLPVSWYNSAYWGQIESIYSFFILLAFFWAIKNHYFWAVVSLGFSALVKPTGLFVLPVFLIYILRKKKILDLISAGLLLVILTVFLYFPFHSENTLFWAIDFYLKSFKGELNYLVSNAFNFWALLFGFDQRPDNARFFGITYSLYGFLIFFSTLVLICYRLWNYQNKKYLIYSAFLSGFAAFLFLPRMHERYFFTAYIFLAIMSAINKQYRYIFLFMSLVNFFNLYHFWWKPEIIPLVNLLSNMFFIRGIIIISLGIFFYLLFFKNEFIDNHR